jgi:hypothetical protein
MREHSLVDGEAVTTPIPKSRMRPFRHRHSKVDRRSWWGGSCLAPVTLKVLPPSLPTPEGSLIYRPSMPHENSSTDRDQ